MRRTMSNKDIKLLTTGQVAEICYVAPRTVVGWVDSGALKGYRIPGSRDRRVPFLELKKFIINSEMPDRFLIEWIEEKTYGKKRIKPIILSAGTVAKICDVAPRTVTNWFDKGKLKGYRLPNSRDRRILSEDVREFMVEYNIPTSFLDEWLEDRISIYQQAGEK